MNLKGTKKKNQVSNVNIFEQQELLKKIEVVRDQSDIPTILQLQPGVSWKPKGSSIRTQNSVLSVMTCLF